MSQVQERHRRSCCGVRVSFADIYKSAPLQSAGSFISVGDYTPTETSLFYSPLKEVGVFSDEINFPSHLFPHLSAFFQPPILKIFSFFFPPLKQTLPLPEKNNALPQQSADMSALQNNIEQPCASVPLANLQLPYVTAPSQTYPKQSLRCLPVFEMPFGSMSAHITSDCSRCLSHTFR